MSNYVKTVRLTRSEEMALIEILIDRMRDATGDRGVEFPSTFINCSTDPETTTTVADLLHVIVHGDIDV